MLKGCLFDMNNILLMKLLFYSGGAFGVFETTDDLSDICKAAVFKKGTKTRVLIRFSTVGAYRTYKSYQIRF